MGAVEIKCQKYNDIGMRIDDEEELTIETLNYLRFEAQELYYSCGKRNESTPCPGRCALSRIGQGDLNILRRVIGELRKNNQPPEARNLASGS